MKREDFPVFCGKVLKVGPVIEDGSAVYTVLQYLPGLDNVQSVDAMTALFPSIPKPEGYVPLEQRMKQAIVPLRLEAAVFEGSDVRARFSKEPSLTQRECYEIEVISGPPTSEMLSTERYKGYKHIKVLD